MMMQTRDTRRLFRTRAVQLLRAFTRTRVLASRETVSVKWTLAARDVSIFDVATDEWTVARGAFQVRVGSSSRDIRLVAPLIV